MWFAGIDLGWQGAPSGVALLAFRPPHHLSLVADFAALGFSTALPAKAQSPHATSLRLFGLEKVLPYKKDTYTAAHDWYWHLCRNNILGGEATGFLVAPSY